MPSGAVNISSRAGTATAQFLKLEMGGRHAAMGGTYAAYGHDVFTLWGQPAALASAPSAWQIGFQHTEWFQGVTQEYAGATGQLGARSRIGVVFNTVGVDDLQRTTENANGQLAAVGGTFGSRDYGLSVHYGLKMNEYLGVGAAIRYIRSEIDDVSADGVAADLGVRLQVRDVEGLTLGLAVTNAGTGLKYISQRDDFPLAVRGGAAYWMPRWKLLLAADVVKYIDRDVDGGVGAEWQPIEFMKLRAGYRSQGRDVGEGLTAGIGFNFSGLEIDYAYVPFGALGEAHRISAGYLFGGGRVDEGVTAAASAPSAPRSSSVTRRPAAVAAPAAAAPSPAVVAPAPVVSEPEPGPAALPGAPQPLRRRIE